MISLKDLSKSYTKVKDKVDAVKKLSLEVEKGELFGFLGPNGAGKTTTIKMMIGLLNPDQGHIVINGIDAVKNRLASKKIIGFVPEEPLLYDKMRGGDFLSFIADVYEVDSSKRRKITELAELFEIREKLGDSISSYSHGMRQKTAIIAALLHDPEVLILDEPIIGLDPKAAFNLKDQLKELCAKGKTIFFSTHVMEVAEKLCHRVGIINKGELLAAAPFEELKAKSGHLGASLEELFLELTNEIS
ncbi:MAG: ABC transporter ATP-binding protein [Spirochaetales bacterium]|nr:ABC transporter ATP-binding protein [Spirochaetales bacterium]